MKKGFTLTEVLITLVVLGALALILIPNFSKIMPDDNVIKYQKAFYTLQEIVNDMVNDENTCQTEDDNNVLSSDDIFDEPLKNCNKTGGARTLEEEICDRLSTVNGTSCTNGSVKQTTNGMQFYIPQTALDDAYTEQSIIVGLNATPAITNASTRNPDNSIFIIKVGPNGKVVPDKITGAGAYDDGDLLKKNPTKD